MPVRDAHSVLQVAVPERTKQGWPRAWTASIGGVQYERGVAASVREGGITATILKVCLVCAFVLVLGGSLAACSFDNTTGPTNFGPFSDMVRDVQAAGVTVLVAGEGPSEYAKKGELYLLVQAAEGQDADEIADTLVSLAGKYKKELHLRWLHVVIQSTEGFYDRIFDLTSSTRSTT